MKAAKAAAGEKGVLFPAMDCVATDLQVLDIRRLWLKPLSESG